MKFGLGSTLLNTGGTAQAGVSPTLSAYLDQAPYTTDAGFANQASVGSANFNLRTYVGPSLTYTRATAATFRGSNGLIQYAPENLLRSSQQFDSGNWAKAQVLAVAAGTYTAPNGAANANLIRADNVSNTSGVYQGVTDIVSGETYTLSFYVKKFTDHRYVNVSFSYDIGRFVTAVFDLDGTGTTATQIAQGATTGTVVATSKTSVGDGWYRLTLSGRIGATAATATGYFWLSFAPAATGNTFNSYGQISSNYTTSVHQVLVWGAQLERASAARPYISTTSDARYGPRFEYATNGEPLGLLMEEQSQNLLSYSEQFDNASWTPSNLNTTGTPAWINTETAPNGTITAEKLIENNQNNYHYVTRVGGVAVVNGTAHTWSVYAKKAERSWLVIDAYSSTGAACWFDLNNGVTGTTAAGATSSIVSVGNGWYRCSVTRTTATTSASMSLSISTGNGVSAYLGNGTSGIYIWGAQLEQKPFATSYIPTVGGPLTRNADVVTCAISSWFNLTEGTVVVSGDRNNNPTINASAFDSFYEFTGSGGCTLVHASDGITEAIFDATGNSATAAGATIGSLTGVAASYSSTTNLLHISRDGLAAQSGPVGGLGVMPVTLNIGYAPINMIGNWNGHVKSFRYYPKAYPTKLQQYSQV